MWHLCWEASTQKLRCHPAGGPKYAMWAWVYYMYNLSLGPHSNKERFRHTRKIPFSSFETARNQTPEKLTVQDYKRPQYHQEDISYLCKSLSVPYLTFALNVASTSTFAAFRSPVNEHLNYISKCEFRSNAIGKWFHELIKSGFQFARNQRLRVLRYQLI